MENVVQTTGIIPRRSSLTSTATKSSSASLFERQNSYNPRGDFGPNHHGPQLGPPAHSPSAPTSVPGAAHRLQDIPRNHSNTNRPSGMSSSTASSLPARHHHHHHSSHHLPTSSQSSQHPTSSAHHHHHPEPYPKSAPQSSTSNKGGVRGRVTVVCAECKRLKLRCSRDRPCTSCVKRACTDRCRYRNDDQPSSTPASSSSLPNTSSTTSSAAQNGLGPHTHSGAYHSGLGANNNSSHHSTASSASANPAGFHQHPLAAVAQSALAAEHQHRLLGPPLQPSLTEHAYRIVSTNCVQCSSAGLKCDRREPCSSCSKLQRDGECTYPGLSPPPQTHTDVTVSQALVRLARLESQLSELTVPECDQCMGVGLKCDGRSPCSWCVRRSSAAAYEHGRHSPSEGPNVLPPLRSANSCTYAAYVEQTQRNGLHSPQPSLHANGTGSSRDRSPYAVRVMSPPPPSSSHSNASLSQLATGSAASSAAVGVVAEVLTRLATSEDRLGSYARSHSHSFSHGHSLSAGGGGSSSGFGHGHSLSHGSIGSLASVSAQRDSGLGASAGGVSSASGGLASTLTPITPSHPSSLHHYAVSSGASGSGPYHHHHSGSISSQHAPEMSHQRSSSRHSPPQHHLLTPSYEYGSSPSYHHPPSAERERGDGPDRDGPGHRPRQLSVSNLARPGTAGTPQTATASPGQYGSSPNQFGFGGQRDDRGQQNGRTSSYTNKMPTPPGSSSSTTTAGQTNANANQTKLPEISNILTLLSPAPAGDNGPNGSAKSPHAFPTPVSGVVSAGHSLLSLGGSSSIQHLQSDVRGSSHTATHQHRPTISGSGFSSFIGSANASRRGSSDTANSSGGGNYSNNNKQSEPMSPTMAVDAPPPPPSLSPIHSRSESGARTPFPPPSTTSTTPVAADVKTQTMMQEVKHETVSGAQDSRSEEEMEVDEIDNDSNP